MSKITRKTALVFGSSASADQIKQFGSLAAGSPLSTTDIETIQALSNWIGGWFAAVIGDNSPAIEDMNAMCYVFGYQIAYLLEMGVQEWDDGTTYYTGSIASDGAGSLYYSLTDANLNQALSVTTQWRKIVGPSTIQTKTATYQVLAGDKLIKVSSTFTLTMPDATLNSGSEYLVKKTDSNASTVTLAFLSGQTADGASTLSLSEQYSFYRLMSDGSNFQIVGAG